MDEIAKYTIHGCAVDKVIDQQLRDIVQEIISNLPEVKVIFLAGGFGRGEGSVKLVYENNTIYVYPVKDFDFFLIFDRNIPFNKIKDLRKMLDRKLNKGFYAKSYYYTSFTVDLNATILERCNLLPDIMTYELKVASHLLYGPDIRDKIKIGRDDIPLRSGARILFQKGISLIGQFSTEYLIDSKLPDDKREMFIYESAKVFVELGTSLSILAGVYEPSYKERGLLLSKRYKELFPELYKILPDLGQKIIYFTEFKLDPKFSEIDDPIALWFTARKYLLEVLKYYIYKYIGVKEQGNYKIFCSQMRSRLRNEYYKPLISHVLNAKFGIKPPVKILSIFNKIFQLYGNLSYIRNVSNSGEYYIPMRKIDFSCPALDLFYATLILLNSIDEDGGINMENLVLVNDALKLRTKNDNKYSDKKYNNAWENSRKIYLDSLHLLPYMY